MLQSLPLTWSARKEWFRVTSSTERFAMVAEFRLEFTKQIEAIEKEIRETPYHKGTEHHIGRLRARIARLRDRFIEGQMKRRKGGGGGGFAIKKFGDATVVLVGLPSVGKSTLLNKLTNAKSPVATYAFTTVSVIPGMMKYKGALIQILDVPGLVEGAAMGRGRGREVLSVVRSADLLLIIVEVGKENSQFNKINGELYLNGVRVNGEPPRVRIRKTLSGGLKINLTAPQELDRETIDGVIREFGISNAEVFLEESVKVDRLVDLLSQNCVYVPALFVLNKIDLASVSADLAEVQDGNHLKGGFVSAPEEGTVRVSAEKGIGLDELREAIWVRLGLVRVYLRRPGGGVDRGQPLMARKGDRLEDVLEKLGDDVAEGKKEARIWGPGAKFSGQMVSLATEVMDEMEVMFV